MDLEEVTLIGFKCRQCSKILKSRDSWRSHIITIHTTETPKPKCSEGMGVDDDTKEGQLTDSSLTNLNRLINGNPLPHDYKPLPTSCDSSSSSIGGSKKRKHSEGIQEKDEKFTIPQHFQRKSNKIADQSESDSKVVQKTTRVEQNSCDEKFGVGRPKRVKVIPNYKESTSEDSENGSNGMNLVDEESVLVDYENSSHPKKADIVDDSEEEQFSYSSLSEGPNKGDLKRHHCETCPRSFYSSASLTGHRDMCSGTKKIFRTEFASQLPIQRENNKIADQSQSDSKVVVKSARTGEISSDEDIPLESYRSKSVPQVPQGITQKTESKPTTSICPHCNKLLYEKQSLIVHVHIHTGEESYNCSNCPVRIHSTIPLGTDNHICDKLRADVEITIRNSRTYVSGRERSWNQIVKSPVKPTAIIGPNNQVGTMIWTATEMKASSRSVSPVTNVSFSSTITSPSSKSLIQITDNVAPATSTLTLETPPITITDNVAPATSTLIVEIPPMTDTTCRLCSKVLSSETCLKNHIRLHTGEKPFVCSRCDVGYYSNKSLSRHIKSCGVNDRRSKKSGPKTMPVGKQNIGAQRREVDDDMAFDGDDEMDTE